MGDDRTSDLKMGANERNDTNTKTMQTNSSHKMLSLGVRTD